MPLPPAYSRFARFLALRDRLAALVARRPGARPVRLAAEVLEDRVVPDGRPLPLPVIYMGSGVGMAPVVKGYDAETGGLNFERAAYEPGFVGGVRVAVGDFTADGYPDVVVAPGPGGGPRVRVLDGKTGDQIPGPLGSFWAYSPAFAGGVHVAAADVDGDGTPDVVAAAGPGGGPHVRVFSGATGGVVGDFFALDPAFRGGITVAAADLTGDGRAEIAVGAGVGGGPRVKVYDPTTWAPVAGPLGSFFAFDSTFRGGVFVGADALAGDLDSDGTPDLAIGSGPGMVGRVKVVSGATGAVLRDFEPFGTGRTGGVRVALLYADDDEFADVVAGTGPGGPAAVRVFSGLTGAQLPAPVGEYAPFGTGLGAWGGVFVAASNDPPPPTANLTGEVWYDADADGTHDPGEGQAVGVGVSLSGGSLLTPLTTVTDAGGEYAFNGVAAGSYTVTFGAVAGHTYTTPSGGAAALTLYAGINTLQSAGVTATYTPPTGAPAAKAPNPETCETLLDSNNKVAPAPKGNRVRNPGYPAPPGTNFPVRYRDGLAVVPAIDFTSGGFGGGWGQARSWSNDPRYATDSLLGNGWVGGTQPRLLRDGASIVVITNAATALYYDGQGTPDADGNYPTYAPRFTVTDGAAYDAAADEFVVGDGAGGEVRFADFGTARPAAQRGAFASATDAGGNVTDVTSWDTAGRATEVQRADGAVTESYLYAYRPATGANPGLLDTVTLRRRVGSGSWETVREVGYEYYDGTTANGTAGDLRLATVTDGASAVLDQWYYRYYTAATYSGGVHVGYAGGMKFALGPAAYARLKADAGGTDALADAAADAAVAGYAENYFEYDGLRRVVKEVAAGAGCSACSDGQGTYTFAYTPSAHAAGFNSWAMKTTVGLPTGAADTVYTNEYGQVLLKVRADPTTTLAHPSYYQYDDRGGFDGGRLVLSAGPGAVTGWSESSADLVGYSAGNAAYLADAAGLVTTYTWGTTTTATSTTPGDVDGFLAASAVQRGETGTAAPQEATDYVLHSGFRDVAAPASNTVYRNANGTGAETTTFTYTWHSGTNQPATITTTLPVVSTGENGSGTATTVAAAYDTFGRATWVKDAGGFLGYAAYDPATGAAVATIADVDTTQPSTFTGLPSGWATPTGGGLHATTTAEVDALGRATKVTHPGGRVDYAVYDDPGRAARFYAGWDATTDTAAAPTVVVRDDRAAGYAETLTMSAAPAVSGGRPTGAESVSSIESLTRESRNLAGQAVSTDAYFDLTGVTYSAAAALGTEGTNYLRVRIGYDKHGQVGRVQAADGTITRAVRDGLGRVVSEWVGTDDTPTTGFWSPTNLTGTDMVRVRSFEYDGGGVGDGFMTAVTEYPGGSAADRVTTIWNDWRGRPVAVKAGAETTEATGVNRPLMYTDFDNWGNAVRVRVYDGDGVTPTTTAGVPDAPSASLLRGRTDTSYDALGQVYRSTVYGVDQTSGTVGSNPLSADVWYDARGLVVKTEDAGGLVTKSAYDGLARPTAVFWSDGGGDTGYADADDVTGDTVLTQLGYAYDAAGNLTAVTTRERAAAATGTSALGTPTTGVAARVSYAGYYHDALGRVTAAVDVGTNGGSAWTRPSTVPAASDTVLVTAYAYDAAGNLADTTAPDGRVDRTEYDLLGRVTKTIENYVNGVVSDGDDKTTTFGYGPAGMTSLTLHLTGGGSQTTEWVYGVTTAGGSGINSNGVVGAVRWPDPTTGAASSSEQDAMTVNALGEPLTATDRNGTTHTFGYDVVGRITTDAATTLGSGVDGAVRRIESGYDALGRAVRVTSLDATSGGSVVNEVVRAFNGFGQLTTEYQSHAGAVNTSTTPAVGYAYTEAAGGANHSRLTAMTYPSGYVVDFDYASGLDDSISRLSGLSDTTGTLEGFTYYGLGTVVARSRPQPGIDLTYLRRSGESTGDGGDDLTGLDRFGRVVDQRWLDPTTGTATDRLQYGYDRTGRRTYRDNLVVPALGEVYTYDGLGQLESFTRGTLNGTKDGVTGTPARELAWDFDAAGNWDGVDVDGVTQTRAANRQNELTAVGAASLGHDANGNLTLDEAGRTLVYDAWNRMVRADASSTTIAAYGYDGFGRRVTATAGVTTTGLYYSVAWQVLEEQVGGDTSARYVWSPVYVDALVLRDRDTDADGVPDERLWVQQDANWNVTAVVDGSGAVIERYGYDPYGLRVVLDANGAADADGQSDVGWVYAHQGLRWEGTVTLYDNRMRWYSPSLGRFTSRDPLGYAAGDQNLYRYVGSSPTGWTDPSGLAWGNEWADRNVWGPIGQFIAGSPPARSPSPPAQPTTPSSPPPDNRPGVFQTVVGGVGTAFNAVNLPGAVWDWWWAPSESEARQPIRPPCNEVTDARTRDQLPAAGSGGRTSVGDNRATVTGNVWRLGGTFIVIGGVLVFSQLSDRGLSRLVRFIPSRIGPGRAAAPETVVNHLAMYQARRFQVGSHTFQLDRSGMTHILSRHHPDYWDGTVKAAQSFLNRTMTTGDIENVIAVIISQNRDLVIRNGTRGMYQIRGQVDGVAFVIGFNEGRIAQFYPVVP